jgi:hypothetical protein
MYDIVSLASEPTRHRGFDLDHQPKPTLILATVADSVQIVVETMGEMGGNFEALHEVILEAKFRMC